MSYMLHYAMMKMLSPRATVMSKRNLLVFTGPNLAAYDKTLFVMQPAPRPFPVSFVLSLDPHYIVHLTRESSSDFGNHYDIG